MCEISGVKHLVCEVARFSKHQ